MDNDRLNASSAPPSLPTAVAVRSFLEQRFVRETGQSLRYAIPRRLRQRRQPRCRPGDIRAGMQQARVIAIDTSRRCGTFWRMC